MGMKRKPNQNQVGKLFPSTQDHVQLCAVLENRFIELCATYERATGTNLVPPRSLDNDIFRWRQMAVRYKRGDYRHTNDEYESVKTIAQWSLDIKCSICKQPTQKIKWKN